MNGTRVSARGRATIFSSLVFQFNKDEPVNILEEINIAAPKAGEPRKWYRVQVPADAGLWVHSDFLEAANILNGVDAAGKPVKLNVSSVRANNLNVRGGAGEQFPSSPKCPAAPSSSSRVPPRANGWKCSLRKMPRYLSPPNSSRANKPVWVSWKSARSYDYPHARGTHPGDTGPAQAHRPEHPTVTLPIQELGQGNGQTPNGVEVKQNPSITNPKPVQPTEVAVNPKPEVATPAKPEAPKPEAPKPVQIAKVNPNLPAPTLTKPKTDKPVRIVTREGIVRRTLDIQSPTGYAGAPRFRQEDQLPRAGRTGCSQVELVCRQTSPRQRRRSPRCPQRKHPVLLVNTLKGELTQEFISKIAAARKEAVEKAQQEAEDAKRKAKEEDSKPEESAPEQSGEDKPEAN